MIKKSIFYEQIPSVNFIQNLAEPNFIVIRLSIR